MNNIAIITDSNSGITREHAQKLGITVLPMPFTIDDEDYFEDINLTQEEFYERLLGGSKVMTSQPNPASVKKCWDEALQTHDEVVYIPMSSGLSGSAQTALFLCEDYDGRVNVVNNQRISVTQYSSVLDAIEMSSKGYSGKEIKERLEQDRFDSSIYIMVDTLKYLKAGGRLTPAVAALGTILRIKPVLQIQGEKLDTFSLARTHSQAKTMMMNQIAKDITERFGGSDDGSGVRLFIAYTHNRDVAEEFAKEVKTRFPKAAPECYALSLSVSCHIGPGSLALACSRIESY
ncbi:MAG: DegV family protein [Lachnospiraceae bacterium]|nr:DegV family protein [Lachnospiraceae bacterium]